MSKLEPGTVFGRDFRIVRALRAGGMGAVYVADQLSTGKQRALKVMAPELAVRPGDAGALRPRGPGGIEDRERPRGRDRDRRRRRGDRRALPRHGAAEGRGARRRRRAPRARSPSATSAEVLAQIGHALEQAHAQGIVHRDLKPENIFLATSRRRDVAFTAKVLDFGIAKLVEDSRQKTGTQPLGTPLFMAPEQTDRRGRICPATDVWALGLIAFKLLTGRDFWMEADGSLADAAPRDLRRAIPFASRPRRRARARPLEAGQQPSRAAAGLRRLVRALRGPGRDARFQEAGEAVRAFAELATVDAPRGALVAMTGPVDWASMGGAAAAARSAAQQSAVRIQTGGDASVDARAATGLATRRADGAVGGPVPARNGAKAGVVAGVVALALGGFGAYRWFGSTTPRSGAAGRRAHPDRRRAAPAAPAPRRPRPRRRAPARRAWCSSPAANAFMGARDLTRRTPSLRTRSRSPRSASTRPR